jgi:hypothetical protein
VYTEGAVNLLCRACVTCCWTCAALGYVVLPHRVGGHSIGLQAVLAGARSSAQVKTEADGIVSGQ